MQIFLSIIFTLSGIALIYWIKRRKFYRRNVAGLETFKNFESSWITSILERIGKLIGFVLIILGIIFYVTRNPPPPPAGYEKSKNSKEGVKE